MLKHLLLVAQDGLQNPQEEAIRQASKTATSPVIGRDVGYILAAVLILAALLFIWAFFVRKRPKHHHGALVVERAKKGDSEAYGSSGRRRRRKRRPGHPDNWGRNPTLGETGGLP